MRAGVVRNDPVRFFIHFEGWLGGCGWMAGLVGGWGGYEPLTF